MLIRFMLEMLGLNANILHASSLHSSRRSTHARPYSLPCGGSLRFIVSLKDSYNELHANVEFSDDETISQFPAITAFYLFDLLSLTTSLLLSLSFQLSLSVLPSLSLCLSLSLFVSVSLSLVVSVSLALSQAQHLGRCLSCRRW